jgi:hypothetical protein
MKTAYKAELYIGKVKQTKDQKKKHVNQMTKEEIAYLKKQIMLFPTWKAKMSKHLKRKMVTLNLNDVEDMLLDRKAEDFIVEYNETPLETGGTDRRLLLRSTKSQKVKFKTRNNRMVEAQANLCFVISLDHFEIITAYWNKVTDDHENIDWKRYSQHLTIIK